MQFVIKTTHQPVGLPVGSVTKCGEIAPLWHDFKSLGHIFEVLFSIWQNVYHTLAKFYAIGQVFIALDSYIL